jgi:hypothetical protein
MIEEKELLGRSMMTAVEMRKCIAMLMRDGFVMFYHEAAKNVMYKAMSTERMRMYYMDTVAQAMLNLYVLLDSQR